jgi:SNF2 family DNA or RNA helicase
LTTYPLLMRDCDVLLDREFHAAILDEAQAIKNPKAAVSGIAHRINARHRLALTGTPLENNLGEVWSSSSSSRLACLETRRRSGVISGRRSRNTATRGLKLFYRGV